MIEVREVKTRKEKKDFLNFPLKLYKNNKFEIVSIRKKYYANGTIDAYLMSRKLW